MRKPVHAAHEKLMALLNEVSRKVQVRASHRRTGTPLHVNDGSSVRLGLVPENPGPVSERPHTFDARAGPSGGPGEGGGGARPRVAGCECSVPPPLAATNAEAPPTTTGSPTSHELARSKTAFVQQLLAAQGTLLCAARGGGGDQYLDLAELFAVLVRDGGMSRFVPQRQLVEVLRPHKFPVRPSLA